MTTSEQAHATLPRIYATALDLQRLRLIASARGSPAAGAALLRRELTRITLVDPAAGGPYVRLGAQATYRDLRSGRVRTVRVVLPGSVDHDENQVSVTTPIGAALIGLEQGAIFRWPAADGTSRAIKVLNVDL